MNEEIYCSKFECYIRKTGGNIPKDANNKFCKKNNCIFYAKKPSLIERIKNWLR